MKNIALIILDTQTALIEEHPEQEKELLENQKRLLSACRKTGVPVLYVQHDGDAGDSLERGTPGWQICGEVAPREGDYRIDKHYNSMFRNTSLKQTLDDLGIKTIILCGLQTEYCFDVSVKVAFEYGYTVLIPRETVSTFDNSFSSAATLTAYYQDKIWNGRYATVLPTQQVLEMMR